jgi:LuxR family quorum sensing-dependent transcriptional regulator
MRSPLAATYDLMLEFARAMSLEDVQRVLLKHGARYGVSGILAGIIPRRIIHPAEQAGYVILGHWPEEWAARYFNKQYGRVTADILHCAARESHLFWSDIEYPAGDVAARRIMDEAREFRVIDGLTIPQLTLDGHRIGVSFSGDRIDKSPEAVTVLTVLASYGVARALQIRAATIADPVHLTVRERECLRWISEGKTSADAADILNVSVKAIEKPAAKQKMRLALVCGRICVRL